MQAFLSLKGVDISAFNGVYLKTQRKSIKSKKNKLRFIMRKERAINPEMFIVGDSFAEDVLLARNMKISYFKFENNLSVNEIFEKKASD